MKKILSLLFFASSLFAFQQEPLKLDYEIDITKMESDSFYVTVSVEGIKSDSIIFQFAVAAPGTYSILDAGRFVGDFNAFDNQGKRLLIKRKNVNQIVIYNSSALRKIVYAVDDTYDKQNNNKYVMSCHGTNIEYDNAVFNAQVVCGYFLGHQNNPINIKFIYPKGWVISTALPKNGDTYLAEDYDHLVDSPVMLGNLTINKFSMHGTDIEVSCYSQSEVINASQIAEKLKPYIDAIFYLLGELPVKRYVFIYNFQKEIGDAALEHNYSSYHSLTEAPLNDLLEYIAPISSHEFCHIITPLHIRSDVISNFNFASPTPTMNIWFYEGFVEWMSRMSIVKGGLITVDKFLEGLSNNYRNYFFFDTTMSLRQSSLGCYSNDFQWAAAYSRGCMLGVIIDLELLKLSDGKTGLIDVMKHLYKIYDSKKTFADTSLIEIIGDITYPEIQTILEKYVNGTYELPIADLMKEVGCEYKRELHTGRYTGYIRDWGFTPQDSNWIVSELDVQDSLVMQLGINEGDKFKKLIYNGEEITINSPRWIELRGSSEIGVPFTWVVERDGKELQLTTLSRKKEIILTHKITLAENPAQDQIAFRNKWLSKLGNN